METFQLEGHEYIQLNQLLKLTGIADSGGDANQLILDGLVKVNEQPASEKRKKIRAGDIIQVGESTIQIAV
ncbi:MAG: RNA-binding S4 domain-containing protein [Bacteroidetes bacterium]|nr:RNA-binding S4 domain-containing protein [Bacteroidota bacterium]MBU1580585.1 RNA-binding S4 domain-containing protein [Bacteroidota bacterium]MBU2466417.1 RNA-binding S4 domain-containing protein [Bacteroidota bacterium]MBU2557388.1 RNA-binding S4 domain-containing protein [Bacteroidota bacterium]